jgi:hypothetical protein
MMAAKQISSRLLLLLLIISLALRIVGLRDKMLVSPIKLGQWLVGPQVVLVPINFKLDRPLLRLTLALKDKAQTRRLILSQPQL